MACTRQVLNFFFVWSWIILWAIHPLKCTSIETEAPSYLYDSEDQPNVPTIFEIKISTEAFLQDPADTSTTTFSSSLTSNEVVVTPIQSKCRVLFKKKFSLYLDAQKLNELNDTWIEFPCTFTSWCQDNKINALMMVKSLLKRNYPRSTSQKSIRFTIECHDVRESLTKVNPYFGPDQMRDPHREEHDPMGVPRSHLLEKITKTLLTELQAVKRELKEGVMELSNTLISVTALRDEFEEKLLGMQTSLESMDEKVIEALTKYTESNLKWTPDEAFHDN